MHRIARTHASRLEQRDQRLKLERRALSLDRIRV